MLGHQTPTAVCFQTSSSSAEGGNKVFMPQINCGRMVSSPHPEMNGVPCLGFCSCPRALDSHSNKCWWTFVVGNKHGVCARRCGLISKITGVIKGAIFPLRAPINHNNIHEPLYTVYHHIGFGQMLCYCCCFLVCVKVKEAKRMSGREKVEKSTINMTIMFNALAQNIESVRFLGRSKLG